MMSSLQSSSDSRDISRRDIADDLFIAAIKSLSQAENTITPESDAEKLFRRIGVGDSNTQSMSASSMKLSHPLKELNTTCLQCQSHHIFASMSPDTADCKCKCHGSKLKNQRLELRERPNFECRRCGGSLPSQILLEEHISNNLCPANRCLKCNVSFPTWFNLAEHHSDCSSECGPCKYCSKRFNESRHAHQASCHKGPPKKKAKALMMSLVRNKNETKTIGNINRKSGQKSVIRRVLPERNKIKDTPRKNTLRLTAPVPPPIDTHHYADLLIPRGHINEITQQKWKLLIPEQTQTQTKPKRLSPSTISFKDEFYEQLCSIDIWSHQTLSGGGQVAGYDEPFAVGYNERTGQITLKGEIRAESVQNPQCLHVIWSPSDILKGAWITVSGTQGGRYLPVLVDYDQNQLSFADFPSFYNYFPGYRIVFDTQERCFFIQFPSWLPCIVMRHFLKVTGAVKSIARHNRKSKSPRRHQLYEFQSSENSLSNQSGENDGIDGSVCSGGGNESVDDVVDRGVDDVVMEEVSGESPKPQLSESSAQVENEEGVKDPISIAYIKKEGHYPPSPCNHDSSTAAPDTNKFKHIEIIDLCDTSSVESADICTSLNSSQAAAANSEEIVPESDDEWEIPLHGTHQGRKRKPLIQDLRFI